MRADSRPPMNEALYRMLQLLALGVLRLLFRLRVEGLQHVPKEGPVLLCVNHISAFDPPAVGAVMNRPVHFMAKIELFSYLGWLLPAIGAYPVNRDVRDAGAVRSTLRLMRRGRVVGLFPEGHRQTVGVLGQPRPGSGALIAHSGAVVIPVAVRGPWKLFHRVEIRFGAPVEVRHGEDAAKDVMRAIARIYYPGTQTTRGLPWAESD